MSSAPAPAHPFLRHAAWAGVALLAALLLALGPARPASAAPPRGWEYQVVAWSEEDTGEVMRQVTGATELADPLQLARALERQGPLLDDPRVQAAVDARLQEKLRAAGAAGWELSWLREQTSLAGGAPFRTASLYFKRPLAG